MNNAHAIEQPTRDRFSVALSCAGCGQAGSALWEENTALNPHGPQRSLISLSDGFRHEPMQQQKSGDPAIYCDSCNTPQPD